MSEGTPGRKETGRPGRVIAGIVAAASLLGACTGSPDRTAGSATSSATSPSASEPATIPQPVVPEGVPVAPESERVDLAMPTFSDPTNITNPLFPVSEQASVVLLGHVDDKPFRTEVTLLPETMIIEWEGQRVEVVVSQYNAFLGGSIEEVAYDLYAQADDGSVWYFGEELRLPGRRDRRHRGDVARGQGRAGRDDHAGGSAGG